MSHISVTLTSSMLLKSSTGAEQTTTSSVVVEIITNAVTFIVPTEHTEIIKFMLTFILALSTVTSANCLHGHWPL